MNYILLAHGRLPDDGMRNLNRGFTLLEVLLALVVISVGLMALVQAAGFSQRQVADMRHHMNAYQVADQVLMQVYQQPQIEDSQGRQRMDDETYYWSVEVQTTDNPTILRYNIRVGLERSIDYAQAQLTGFKKSG